MQKLKGLATGIGSLPHKDAQLALDLVFKYCPRIPFWPQLPKRDIREGMVNQYSENIPCLKLSGADLVFDPQDKEKELEIFYEKIIGIDLEHFKISQEYALGLYAFYGRLKSVPGLLEKIEFIKCHITGPFTFAASIKDETDRLLLADPIFMQVCVKGLLMKALWQIKFLRGLGKKIIVFIDEPYLAGFGSAYTPLNKEDIVKGLTELTEGIKEEDVLVGVHCCGNTDWPIFTDIKTIDIVNFDAFGYLDKFILYAGNLNEFLKRGGVICWGIVPTQLFTGQESVDLLIRKLKEGLNALINKGIEEDLLLNNLLISPSCGIGTFDVRKAEKVFGLLAETSAFIQEYL